MDGLIYIGMDWWLDLLTYFYIDGQMDGWMNGWIDGWMYVVIERMFN